MRKRYNAIERRNHVQRIKGDATMKRSLAMRKKYKAIERRNHAQRRKAMPQ